MRVIAINIADNINIKGFKNSFEAKPTFQSASELFYTLGDKYMTIYNNGVVAFANLENADIDILVDKIKPHMKNPQERIMELIKIEFVDNDKVTFEDDILQVPTEFKGNDLFRIVMYDLSQTVGIDYYSSTSEKLLGEVEKFAEELETKGKLSISKIEMNKFIGKSLSTKNKIVNNLYIFDVPDIAWDDPSLEIVHKVMSRNFDLQNRIKELQYTFEVIDDNLDKFQGMQQHEHSALLEIVVIILIFVEILKSFGAFNWIENLVK